MRKLVAVVLACLMAISTSAVVFAAESPFEDVRGRDLTRAVSALYESGIVDNGSTFEPHAEISILELLTWLGRAVDADDYLAWGIENDLISDGVNSGDSISQSEVNAIFVRFNNAFGKEVGGFPAPSGNATRGQVAIFLAPGLVYERTAPVSVSGGYVSGFVTDEGVNVFKGIPFAAPPVGDLRWSAPAPVVPWEGVLPTINWSASVIQPPQGPFMMWTEEFIIEDTGYSEDALTLNVWTRDGNESSKPVIVYIYGGGFTSGGASAEVYNGEHMAAEGVVFVVITYRVGVMGFMAHSGLADEHGVSGNYGILDAIASLEWVRDNIAQFGGDPSNVTIMGQSAGAALVHYLLQSPLANGLFHRAVSTGFNNMWTQYPTLEAAQNIFEEAFAGYSIEELRAMDAFDVMAINNNPSRNIDGRVLLSNFGEALITGATSDVPLMTGMVREDSALFLPGFGAAGNSVEDFETFVNNFFGELAPLALELYPATEDNVAQVASDLRDDILAARQTWIAKGRTMGGAQSDSFIFLFTHVMPDATDANFGAFHTSEIPYFFNIFSNFRQDVWTEDDFAMGGIASSYLINFARSGNPNGAGLVPWVATSGEYRILELGTTVSEITLSPERAALFNDLFEITFADILNVPAIPTVLDEPIHEPTPLVTPAMQVSIVDGEVFVPIRAFAYSIGASEVDWDGANQAVIITLDGVTHSFTVAEMQGFNDNGTVFIPYNIAVNLF